jgi:enoyl-CoA hydratase/carnithine racemase
MASTLVSSATEGGIVTLTLSDPPTNTVTHEMMKELDEAILDARFDNDVHAIVITGYGDFFSGGINLEMIPEVDAAYAYYFGLHASETLTRIENTPKLTIAALNGHAIGVGLEIALACDFRVAKKGGSMCLPEVKLGLMPLCGGTHRVARIVGRTRAMRFLIEGQTLDYLEAHNYGLVDHVWDTGSREAFDVMVTAFAQRHTPPEGATQAIGRIKRSLQVGSDLPIDQAVALDRELAFGLFGSPDCIEGVRAYLEKRKPTFQGR